MATYYGTYGQKVQYLASDPSPVQIGQVWYNYTSATLKVRAATTTGTWASGGNANTARYFAASAGTATATLIAGGGETPSLPYYYSNVESYNGTSWTSSTSLPETKSGSNGAGTNTAALVAFGENIGNGNGWLNTAITFNGTSWTSAPSGSNSYGNRASRGTSGTSSTSVLVAGGNDGAGNTKTAAEKYNGTSWTSASTINTGRMAAGSGSTSDSSGFIFGGLGATNSVANAESYNGTSWTSGPSLGTASFGGTGFGTQTLAAMVGGDTVYPGPIIATTQIWNGTSWSNNPNNYPITINRASSAGTQASGIVTTGVSPSVPGSFTNATNIFTGPGVGTTKTVTVS